MDQEGKETNTKSQHEATIRLFKGYWGENSLRKLRRTDAVRFIDTLKTFDPSWGRSPKTKSREYKELVELYAGQGKRLGQKTLNRHIRTLSAIWKFGKRRELASGDNPFEDLTKRVISKSYIRWEDEELKKIFENPPKRDDLFEVMKVALLSGMRINEIVSLTWRDIREEDKIKYFNVTDAKTEAGIRKVPIHSKLNWLFKKKDQDPTKRIWPKFNREGPGKSPGADASKLFGSYKKGLEFNSREKSFHSFRKNATTLAERAQVPINEWQEIIGHEKNFTYKVYSGGITMKRKQEIIELLDYPDIQI